MACRNRPDLIGESGQDSKLVLLQEQEKKESQFSWQQIIARGAAFKARLEVPSVPRERFLTPRLSPPTLFGKPG